MRYSPILSLLSRDNDDYRDPGHLTGSGYLSDAGYDRDND